MRRFCRIGPPRRPRRAAVFLCPAVFAQGNHRTAWLPLARKGDFAGLPSWLYHKDEWAKRHPIFDGLPAGGLMDYTFYRELIPASAFTELDPPAEAVAAGIDASCGYSSGLLVAVYPLGAGEFILNSLQIRDNLGPPPGRRPAAAEHASLCRREDASTARPTSGRLRYSTETIEVC